MACPTNEWRDSREKRALIENPYVFNDCGFVSQDSVDLYDRYMNKHKNVDPNETYVKPATKKDIDALEILVSKRKNTRRRRKAVSSEFVNDDEDDEGVQSTMTPSDKSKPKCQRVKVLLPRNARRKSLKNYFQKTETPLKKRPPIPIPMTYEELLKLAERKQHEPVLARSDQRKPERPMTKKEKLLYLARMQKFKTPAKVVG